jgi:hypothetical protein
MRKALMLLIVASLGCALAAAGCGGDDDDDDTTAATTATTEATGGPGDEPLSKEEFIKAADGICRQGDQEINREAGRTFGNERPSQQAQEDFVTDTVLPNIQAQVDGIRALTPPEGDEDQVTAILDAAQRAIDETEDDPSALTQEGGGSDPFAEANRLAQDYGLTACGGG